MIEESRKIEQDLHIDNDFTLKGMVTENIYVHDGGSLRLYGTCIKYLFIEKGGKVYLYGTVNLSVNNNGGYLEVYGIVGGKVYTNEDGNTLIDCKSHISGNQF
jgi:hypothetical protein